MGYLDQGSTGLGRKNINRPDDPLIHSFSFQESCSKCGGSSWVRAGMIAERAGPKLGAETLSVRGNEEKWIGGAVAANINI